jgi:predicted nuclease of predicted toxin-antitoxin system
MNRLPADENFPAPAVQALRQPGYDVITLQERGKANQQFPDSQALELATVENRTVLALNRKHFIGLHQASSKHAGIIVCTVDLDFAGQAHRIGQPEIPLCGSVALCENRNEGNSP